MGPSGAGKTSLLNVLAGYINRGINGTVMLNDKRMQSRDMRKISAYIMQDDRHAVLSSLKINPETFVLSLIAVSLSYTIALILHFINFFSHFDQSVTGQSELEHACILSYINLFCNMFKELSFCQTLKT